MLPGMYQDRVILTKTTLADHLLNWPKNSQPDEYYINEEGMYELVFSSRQPLAKKFRKHCCNVMFPHIRKQLVDKMQEDHQKAI